jgi:glycosyltransferase involved in cell wall biosynthesis
LKQLGIGLIGTRFAGLDGVTLESIKVAEVLESLGHRICWFAGRLDRGFSPGLEVPIASFDTADNLAVNAQVFGAASCDLETLDEIERTAALLQEELATFVADHQADVLIPQNALAIPMQVPLGLAIARYAADTGIPTLAHHHDFVWERDRFWPNAIGSILEEAFPATGPNIGHLVINSLAREELEQRTGAEARILPNIMDFEHPPPRGEGDAFRRSAGLGSDARIILQPTRMVPRKGIEYTVDLADRLGDPRLCVVVTHPEPDEGLEYVEDLLAVAANRGVDLRVVPAEPPLELRDAYTAADLVAYPSRIEGFGNALLEALYYKRPLLVNRYPVYVADIGPTGIEAIEMDGTLTDGVVAAARRWLDEPSLWADAVERNYEIGREHYAYAGAAEVLAAALGDLT